MRKACASVSSGQTKLATGVIPQAGCYRVGAVDIQCKDIIIQIEVKMDGAIFAGRIEGFKLDFMRENPASLIRHAKRCAELYAMQRRLDIEVIAFGKVLVDMYGERCSLERGAAFEIERQQADVRHAVLGKQLCVEMLRIDQKCALSFRPCTVQRLPV